MASKASEYIDNGDGTWSAPTYWKSRDGRYVVIKGPFPHGLARTADCETLEQATRRSVTGFKGIMVRAATKRERFAKTLTKNIAEISNELGEVAP